MQNIQLPQRNHVWRVTFLLVCFAALLSLIAFPKAALAKSYAMPTVEIHAEVNADGSLDVVEQRTFDFNGEFSCVWWDFNGIYSPRILRPNSVAVDFPDRMLEATASGNSATDSILQEVPFDSYWRSEGGPGKQAYSFDETYNSVYVFFDARNEQMVVTLDYTVENAVDVYKDCAELYWQFVGPDWAEDSRNVVCTISLPSGEQVGVPEETVRAWGHGPLSGSVAFNDAGTEVTYSINRVKAGEYAEARVVFPVEWMRTAQDYEGSHAYQNLDDIVREEAAEAAKANRGRIASIAFFGVFGLIALISIAWAAMKLVFEGIEHRPNFTDSYWRDVPNKDVHPATIGRLCRWNKESSGDVLATVLHLANAGAISINKGIKGPDGTPLAAQSGAAFGQEDYYLALNAEVANELTNPIDTNLIGFLFGDIAYSREDILWLGDIDSWGEKHPKSFHDKLDSWQKLVARDVKKQNYFEEKGESNQSSAWMLAAGLVVAGIYLSFEFENFWPLIILGITAIVVFLLSINMPRRTQNGAEDYAHAMGLKKWLKDFTALDERLPTDVKVWGEFMVYAQLFGVAKDTIKRLRAAVPELFAEADSLAASDGRYVSWDTWYVSDSFGTSAHDSFSRSFDSMWTRTAAMADAAHSVSTGGGGRGIFSGSDWSSGGGGGGGFSGGGGGGFGGGGGGAR